MTFALPFTRSGKKLTIAIVGLGSMGQRYASILSSHPSSILHGCDTRSDKVFNSQTHYHHVSLNKLLGQATPTVAVIAVPAVEHLQVLRAIKFANPTCAVLMEKPLTDHALTEDEAHWCSGLEGLNAVGYNWRFHPFAKELWKMREDICDISFFVAQDMTTWPGTNYCDPLREFSHELDLVQFLTTNPEVVESKFSSFATEPARLRYRVSGIHEQGEWRVHILPNSTPASRWVRVKFIDGTERFQEWDQTEDVIENTYRQQVTQLVDAYLYDRPSQALSCSLSDALQTTRLIVEAEKIINYKSFCEGLQ